MHKYGKDFEIAAAVAEAKTKTENQWLAICLFICFLGVLSGVFA